MPKQLDLTPLRKALASLDRALRQDKDEFVRDSVVQRFEFSFELTWKSLRRYFEWNQGLIESNVKNIFREAAKQGLIERVEDWFVYHRARNETSHTYDEQKAEEIYQLAGEFYVQASDMLKKLERLVVGP